MAWASENCGLVLNPRQVHFNRFEGNSLTERSSEQPHGPFSWWVRCSHVTPVEVFVLADVSLICTSVRRRNGRRHDESEFLSQRIQISSGMIEGCGAAVGYMWRKFSTWRRERESAKRWLPATCFVRRLMLWEAQQKEKGANDCHHVWVFTRSSLPHCYCGKIVAVYQDLFVL